MALVAALELEMVMDTVLVRETELVMQISHALETLTTIGARVVSALHVMVPLLSYPFLHLSDVLDATEALVAGFPLPCVSQSSTQHHSCAARAPIPGNQHLSY
jgi:hypothetical protein